MQDGAPLISVEGLSKRFHLPQTLSGALAGRSAPTVHALTGVDLAGRRGETRLRFTLTVDWPSTVKPVG